MKNQAITFLHVLCCIRAIFLSYNFSSNLYSVTSRSIIHTYEYVSNDSISHFFNVQMSFLKNYHMARVLENTVLVYLIRDNNKKEVFSMKGLVGFEEIEK